MRDGVASPLEVSQLPLRVHRLPRLSYSPTSATPGRPCFISASYLEHDRQTYSKMIDTNLTEFDWSGWSEWESLAGLDMKAVTTGPGAYVIAANKPLHRAVGSDEEQRLAGLAG